MIYLDYDGVIGDTENGLFDDYYRIIEYRKDFTKEQYIKELDWRSWLRKCGPKKNSFEFLKMHSSKYVSILTTCWSINEAREKIIYLRENGLDNNIIICPGHVLKSEVVCPKLGLTRHLLVDDHIENVVDWEQSGGQAFIFEKGPYKGYNTVYSLEEAFDFYYC